MYSYYYEKALFKDSHRLFKPFELVKEENENFREFDRRCNRLYNELINKYETPGNNNRVYMNREWKEV